VNTIALLGNTRKRDSNIELAIYSLMESMRKDPEKYSALIHYASNNASCGNQYIQVGVHNEEKATKEFGEWLKNIYKDDETSKINFLINHQIPNDINLGFDNFEQFVERRKVILTGLFKKILTVSV